MTPMTDRAGHPAATRTAEPDAVYAAALRGAPCRAHGLCARPVPVPVDTWTGPARDSDLALLARCSGPTLDVGCGPGRLTKALGAAGVPALGIDRSPTAVARARELGVAALLRDVFDPVPGEGRWSSVLLADGNIGIGGSPVRLLRRVRQLLAGDGRLVVDLARPGSGLRTHVVRLEAAGRRSRPFRWAVVSPEALAGLAEAAALQVLGVHLQQGRWFAELCPAADPR